MAFELSPEVLLSPWRGRETWLVCFEDRGDNGLSSNPGGESGEDRRSLGDPHGRRGPEPDGDFDDLVFEVAGYGVTAAGPQSFGSVKTRYRH